MTRSTVTPGQLRLAYWLSLVLLFLVFTMDLLNTRSIRLKELELRLQNGTYLLARILQNEQVVDQDRFDDVMREIRLGTHAQIVVLDSNLNAVAYYPNEDVDSRVNLSHAMILTMVAQHESHPPVRIDSPDGITRMVKLNHLDGESHYVVMSDSVTQSMGSYYRRMGVYLALMLLAAGIGYMLLSIQLRLIRSESRFRTMIDDFADIPIQGFLPDGTVVYWNKASTQMYGYSDEEMIGRSIHDIMRSDQNRDDLKRVLKTLVHTKKTTDPIRWALTNKNGDLVEAVTYFTLLTDSDGNHEIFCMDVNVGPLIDAQNRIQDLLNEKEMILKEVHHRIKNNMNTIAGMLWLQADTLKDKTAAQALLDAQGRIMNMMVLYNKLFRSAQFTTLSVKEFIEDMITHIRTSQDPSERIDVTMTIEDAEIDSKTLQTIGMIVNELMSNVYKYAFPLGAEGRVLVSMTFPESGILRLEIHDTGKGIPDDVLDGSVEDGFGMMLIRMLSEQLGAEMDMSNDSGARFLFRIPI